MVPTKGNLKIAANTLSLSKTGYELLDKKRNILMREIMLLVDNARNIQNKIDSTFEEAYLALKTANLELGIDYVEKLSHSIKIDDSLDIKFRSVMGVEIPTVIMGEDTFEPSYGFGGSTSSLDEAVVKFREVKKLTKLLAQVETSVLLLADNIRKTQKRANALKNIIIPRYEEETRNILNALEEKEREEFSRLKVIKAQKGKNKTALNAQSLY